MRAIARERRKTLCVDFDGVIHSYRSGWKSPTIVDDEPVDGALEFLYDALLVFRVCIFSSRSASEAGIGAMKGWLERYAKEKGWDGGREWWLEIEWPRSKPSAFVSLDDRAITFNGVFPPVHDLVMFQTWLEREAVQAAYSVASNDREGVRDEGSRST
jgi:hypothetical protein